MENGRYAKHQVKTIMNLAKCKPKVPAILHRSDHTVRHDGEPQEEISDRHGEDEEVGWSVKLLEVGNGNYHGKIAKHRDDYGSHHQRIHGDSDTQWPFVFWARSISIFRAIECFLQKKQEHREFCQIVDKLFYILYSFHRKTQERHKRLKEDNLC